MNLQKQFALLICIAVATISCKKNETTPEQQVENALDQFVASLVANPPTTKINGVIRITAKSQLLIPLEDF